MTYAQKESILNLFSRRYLYSSYLEDKIDDAQKKGDIDRVMELDAEDDKVIAQMTGMQEVLEILGYNLCFDPRKGDSVITKL